MHRVIFTYTDAEAKARMSNCLKRFAAYQLEAPFPATLMYHFTTPDPVNHPLVMEYSEIYKDDDIFWKHLAGVRQAELTPFVAEMFKEENRAGRSWYVQGIYDSPEQMKIIGQMGASFDCREIAGTLLNEKLDKNCLEHDEEFTFARIRFEAGKLDEAKIFLKEAAKSINPRMMSFYVSIPEPEANENAVEIIMVSADEGGESFLQNIRENLTAFEKKAANCAVYGKEKSKTEAKLAEIFGEKSVNYCKTEIGYVIHPQAKQAFN